MLLIRICKGLSNHSWALLEYYLLVSENKDLLVLILHFEAAEFVLAANKETLLLVTVFETKERPNNHHIIFCEKIPA